MSVTHDPARDCSRSHPEAGGSVRRETAAAPRDALEEVSARPADGFTQDGRQPAATQQQNGVGPDRDATRVAELEREVVQLQNAIATQRHIGTLVGLLAMRYGCTSEQAWQLLVRLSSTVNAKIRTLARVMVEAYDGVSDPADAEVLAELSARLPGGHWPDRGPAATVPTARDARTPGL